ncbi:MAG: TSUP family transporter [Chitinophagaceae bacterium]
MRTLALCCNIIVIFINIYYHWKEKNIDWKNTLLVCSLSIPIAYIGSLIPFEETTFLQILGISLIIVSLMIGLNYFLKNHTLPKNNLIIIGIGGGILLSPVLYLMRFSTPIKIAALSSIFIAVNSIACIIGLISTNNFHFIPTIHIPLLLVVLTGGVLAINYG